MSDLRETAARHIPDLHLEDTPGVQLTDVAAALAIFDEADAEVLAAEEPVTVASDQAPTLRERLQDILARRPRTTIALLCAAVCAVLGVAVAASSSGDAERTDATVERIARRRPVVRARTLPEAAPRAEAEAWLIENADEAYEPVEDALRGKVRPAVRSSLRYVLAAVDEQRAGGGTPQVVSHEPREGLVYFIDALTDDLADEVVRVRRTARAEMIPVTIVVEGQRRADGFLATYAALLGDVRFFVDLRGEYARGMRITQKPTLIGLRPDGRAAFVLVVPPARPDLADKARTLHR